MMLLLQFTLARFSPTNIRRNYGERYVLLTTVGAVSQRSRFQIRALIILDTGAQIATATDWALEQNRNIDISTLPTATYAADDAPYGQKLPFVRLPDLRRGL